MKNFRKKTRIERQIKKNEPVWWSVLKNQAVEFCLATGLHGYKYIAQPHRSKLERIIWAIVVLASLCSAIATMKLAYDYYVTRPTLTVIETTHHGIWNYPFPAVTVCNMNRVSLSLARKFVENLKVPSNISKDFVLQEMKLLLALLRPDIFQQDITRNLSQLQDIFDYNGLSIATVVNLVTQNCSSLIKVCKWKGELISCGAIFEQSFSRDGICCSFNYITPQIAQKQEDARRVTACGYQTGLTMMLDPESKDYLATTTASYGMKIMLHAPFDYPDYNAENVLVGLDVQVFLSVAPEVTYSTRELRSLDIESRDCIFPDESHLIGFTNPAEQNLTFAKYSYLNCMADCRASTIREKCDCIPYYMPQNGTRICNLKDVGCLANYTSWYDTSWPGMDMKNKTYRLTVDSHNRPCGCMPDCSLYRYPVESSQGVLDTNVYYNDKGFIRTAGNNTSLRSKSVVHVFFSDLVSIQYRRDVYYNWYNLFASFGGLLGLFAGFSLMSAFEFFYFFIVRVITDACTTRRVNHNTFHR